MEGAAVLTKDELFQSKKCQVVVLASHKVSVTQLCHCSTKLAMVSVETNGPDCVLRNPSLLPCPSSTPLFEIGSLVALAVLELTK